MKAMKCAIACSLALAAIGTQSIAAESPQRAALAAQSASVGLGRTSLPLLQRQPGPGADVIESRLLGQLTSKPGAISASGNYKRVQDNAATRIMGDNGWRLSVYADGSAAKFSNWDYHVAHLTAVSSSQRPSLDTLDTWGRAFIKSNLAEIISLGPDEQLVTSHSRYEVEGAGPVGSTEPFVKSVVGAIVVYSRTINGVAIIGEGSKVAIQFTSDGTPWAFSYDWPTYAASGTTQAVLPLATIRQRQAKLVRAPKLAVRQEERRFECGYFDAGVRHRDLNAVVQGGCQSETEFAQVGDATRNAADPANGLFRSGQMVVTPAGATMEADKSWPEIAQLQGGSSGARPAATSSGANGATP
jgi:hypothetical protein